MSSEFYFVLKCWLVHDDEHLPAEMWLGTFFAYTIQWFLVWHSRDKVFVLRY